MAVEGKNKAPAAHAGEHYSMYINRWFGKRPDIWVTSDDVTVESGFFKRKTEVYGTIQYAVARVQKYTSKLWSGLGTIAAIFDAVFIFGYAAVLRDKASAKDIAASMDMTVSALKHHTVKLIIIVMAVLVGITLLQKRYQLELIDFEGNTKALCKNGLSRSRYYTAADAINEKLRKKHKVTIKCSSPSKEKENRKA